MNDDRGEIYWREDVQKMGAGRAVLDVLKRIVVHDARDWSASKRDAWLYGIVVGWKDEALRELQQKYRWDDTSVKRLREQRGAFVRLGIAARADHEVKVSEPPEPPIAHEKLYTATFDDNTVLYMALEPFELDVKAKGKASNDCYIVCEHPGSSTWFASHYGKRATNGSYPNFYNFADVLKFLRNGTPPR
jgi:hypothetical protein